MDDDVLIKSAQGGDAAAFERLVNRYYEVIFRMAYKYIGRREAAEDITQEACIKLARNIGQYRFEAAFTSWLYRMVINCAKDWLKGQARHQDHRSGEEMLDKKAGSGNADAAVMLNEVLAQMDDFPDGIKDAVYLVHVEGMNHKEAADILEIKESTVSWRVHEARKLLGEWLGDDATMGKVGTI